MSISRRNHDQLPLDGLAIPPGCVRRDSPDGLVVLELPRWDIDWTVRTGRGGWPKVNPKTGKIIRHRPVWDSLHSNARPSHWSQRAQATRTVINAVVIAASAAGLKPCRHLTVQLVWAPGDNRTADRGNLMGIHKAVLDALARGRPDLPGLQLVPNDSDRWVEELMPRIDRPPATPGLWLEVVIK